MRVTFYTKSDCQLCDEAKASLESLQAEFPHRLLEINVDTESTLEERYGESVPVVQVGAYTLRAPFDEVELRVTLGAAQAGEAQRGEGAAKPSQRGLQLNRGLLFFASHWLAIFNLLVLMYVGLPFAAPSLMKAGFQGPARWIYTAYSPMCHQLAFRSWFLFGEQPAYPRQLAGMQLRPYGQMTGLDEYDLLEARAFTGDERLGYKVALCERDVAIYASILLAGLGYSLVRGRLKPLPVWIWVLVGIVPIALDGGTQLISSLPLPALGFFPARESTPALRTLTGALFGVMNVWLAYPHVEESMAETRALVRAKLASAAERLAAAPAAD